MTARFEPSDAASHGETVEAMAADWLARRDAGLDPAETEAFVAWMARDPAHEAAVARLEETWSLLRELEGMQPAGAVRPDRDLLAPRRTRRTILRWVRLSGAVAAAAALAVIAFHRVHIDAPHDAAQAEYATDAGGYQRVSLPDGSIMELNADTSVQVDYAADARRVWLLRGEAHFAVAKDASRPFITETRAVAVRAVGTAFNVRLGGRDVEVVVTAGTVALQRPPDDEHPTGDEALVHAGCHGVVPQDREREVVVASLDPETLRAALAWQGARLRFSETPLAEVVEQFNSRNAVQLSLADPALADLPVGGSFGADNVEAFVRLLCSSGDIEAEYPAADHIVLRTAR